MDEQAELREEKKALEKKIQMLSRYCSSRITEDQRHAYGDQLWEELEIDVQSVEQGKEKLAKLEESLAALAMQRTLVMQQTLGMQQPSTKRGRDAAAFEASGFTPDQLRARLSTTSPAPVPPRAVPQFAPVQVWLLTGTISEAGSYFGLRKKVYEVAAAEIGYDATAVYTDDPLTSQSDLRVAVYFKEERSAYKAEHILLEYLEERCHSSGHTLCVKAADDHVCSAKVYKRDYKCEHSPVRQGRTDATTPSPPATKAVPGWRMQREYVIKEQSNTVSVAEPRSCHLVEAHCLRKQPQKSQDKCNRIILSQDLHTMFDTRHEVRFYYEGSTDFPVVSYRTRQDTFETAELYRLQLVASFVNVATADYYAPLMRDAVHTTGSNTVKFSIDHPFPDAFLEYLAQRDTTQRKAIKGKHGSLAARESEEDEKPKENEEETEDHTHEESEEDEEEDHTHKRERHGKRPTVPWRCDCCDEEHSERKHQYACVDKCCEMKLCVNCPTVE